MIPILIVVTLFMATARVIADIQKASRPAGAIEVVAIGHQFWWEFRYPGLKVVTANELHVPRERPGAPDPDVHHTDFRRYGSQLLGSSPCRQDRSDSQSRQYARGLTRTRPVFTWDSARSIAEPNTPRCFCASMSRRAMSSTAGFKNKVSRRTLMTPYTRASRIFETTACINCHTVTGTVANGRFGPDLTHIMSRDTIASGAAPNTPANLRLWIRNPDALKPGCKMPAMDLSDQDISAVAAYLETLR